MITLKVSAETAILYRSGLMMLIQCSHPDCRVEAQKALEELEEEIHIQTIIDQRGK